MEGKGKAAVFELLSENKVWSDLNASRGPKIRVFTILMVFIFATSIISGLSVSQHPGDDRIKDDTTPPSVDITNPGNYISSFGITLFWSGSDEGSGIDHYETKLDDNEYTHVNKRTYHDFTGLAEGEHTAYVKAVDNAGNSAVGSVDFVIDRTRPSANAGHTYSGDEDTSILFSAYSSSDSITSVTEYEWDWENDGVYDTVKTSYKASNVFEDPGEYTVKLRVRDKADNTDTDTASVTVYDVTPPSIDLGGPYSGEEDETISFSVSGSDNVGVVQYDWDFENDGSYDAIGAGSSTSHIYKEAGDYTVKVKAEDAAGNTATATASVSIESVDDIPPIVSIDSPERSQTIGSRVVNVEWSGSDRGVGIDHYSIKYGSGFWEDVGTSTSHDLNIHSEGEHIIYVKAVDGNGNTAVDTVNIISDLYGPINCGVDTDDRWINRRNVSLSLTYEDNISAVGSVRVGISPDFSTVWSTDYSIRSEVTFQLPGYQENYTIYAKYEDTFGHESKTISTWIIYDIDEPEGEINIDEGNRTGYRTVNYSLQGSDNLQKIVDYRLKIDEGSWSSWMSYERYSYNVSLPYVDGEHLLKAELRTKYGQVSDVFEDSILLDLDPPVGYISIEDGKDRAQDFKLSLDISASDDHGSITQMRLWNGTWSGWMPYEDTYILELPDQGVGNYKVKAQFKDDIGDISEIVNDTIFIDPYSPVGSVSIENGRNYSFDYNVSLNFSASDPTGEVEEMRIWYNETWGSWEEYTKDRDLEFPHLGTGVYGVKVQYRDDTGNTSSIYEDSINIDPVRPNITLDIEYGDDITIERSIELNISSWDDVSEVDEMKLSLNRTLKDDPWQPYSDSKGVILPDREDQFTIYLQGRTSHGQLTEVVNDTIFLDKTLPTGSINSTSDRILNNTVKADLYASDNVDSIEKMRFCSDDTDISELDWISYESDRWIELPNQTGEHELCVQYKTSHGQVSKVYSDSVKVDLVEPSLNVSFESRTIIGNTTMISLNSSDNYGEIQDMKFSYLNTTSGWIDYSEDHELGLDADTTDEYLIEVQVRDDLNDTSEVSFSLFFDLEKPTVDFEIKENYTDSRSASLEIDAHDEFSNISEVRMNTTDDLSRSRWMDLQDDMNYELPDKDGNYTVYVQVKTSHGQLSRIHSDSVISDTSPPQGSFELVDRSVSSDEVNLWLNATDNLDSISEVEVSLFDDFSVSETYDYRDEIKFEIKEEYGYQNIYVRYITENDQVSEVYTNEVFFDNRGPDIDSFKTPDTVVSEDNLTGKISWEADDDSGIMGYEVYIGRSDEDMSLYKDRFNRSGFRYEFEDNRTVVLKVKAIDELGNTNSVMAATDVDVNYPPRILSEDIPRKTEGCNIEFAITAEDCKDDPLLIEWYIDGEKIGSGDRISKTVEEGDHILNVKVSDGENTVSRDYSITVDEGKTDPEVVGLPLIPLLIAVAALIMISGGSYYFYRFSNKEKDLSGDQESFDKSESEVITDVLRSNDKVTVSEIHQFIEREKGFRLSKEEIDEVCEELVRKEKIMKVPRMKRESEYFWPEN